MVRCFEEKLLHQHDETIGTESDSGTDLVVVIPFRGEMRIKSICVIGGPDGSAPSKLKLYKNESNVDADIADEKKPIQVIDLADSHEGLDYALQVSKFSNVSNLVLGFQENFGADRTQVKFIGLKGELLRMKPKMVEFIYEVRAYYADLKSHDQ